MATAALDKPSLTPPELRRKKAEVDGRLKARDDEQSRLLVDLSGDGVKPDDERWKTADGFTAEILHLRKLSEGFRVQIEAAERWAAVDDDLNGDGSNADGSGRLDRGDPMMPHNDDGNTRHGRFQYSMLKAIRSGMADYYKRPDWKLDGLELETHQEMVKRRAGQEGLHPLRGILIPLDLPIDRRASHRFAERAGIDVSTLALRRVPHGITPMQAARNRLEQRASGTFDTTAGGGAIPTILDTTIIELLRARMVTPGLGARFMTDMQGLFAIPRQATASTFYMVSQGGGVTATNQTIDQVPFSPHTGGVQTTYTRQLLEQINVDAEMFVREDQAAVVARGVETAAFNGQGSGGFPLGILNNMQVAVYAIGVNGGAPTWTQIVTQEAYPAYFNADVGSLAYVTDALTRGTLKTTAKIGSTYPIYLWNTEAPDFPTNGYPCAITNLLPQNIVKGSGTNLHVMIFGNWEDLVYALWSGMDTIVDPFTQAANGGVVITTLQDFDVNIRHYQSFCNCTDIVSLTAPII
jgi:HK97 family phage major capsid protein